MAKLSHTTKLPLAYSAVNINLYNWKIEFPFRNIYKAAAGCSVILICFVLISASRLLSYPAVLHHAGPRYHPRSFVNFSVHVGAVQRSVGVCHPCNPAAASWGKEETLWGPGGGFLQWRVGDSVRWWLLHVSCPSGVQRAWLHGCRVLVTLSQVWKRRRWGN